MPVNNAVMSQLEVRDVCPAEQYTCEASILWDFVVELLIHIQSRMLSARR